MRKINLTIEFEDNDLVEYALRKELDSLLGTSIIDIRTLPDTKELYDNDNTFKALCKAKKDLQLKIDRYVNKTRIKTVYDPNAELDPNSPQNSKYNTKESNECNGCYSEGCNYGCLKD